MPVALPAAEPSLTSPRFSWLHPLVRYVDEEQAVVDLKTQITPAPVPHRLTGRRPKVELLVEVRGSDDFMDEQRVPVTMADGIGTARLQLVKPLRWWPAGMGAQPLHDLEVGLFIDDQLCDLHSLTVGLTSVRPSTSSRDVLADDRTLLVNGQPCAFSAIVPVDEINEKRLLPVANDSLLLVRDHYGPDVLYDAADRAGILLMQCVPVHPEGHPEYDMGAQVQRLTKHPSLAGWFVGHMGRLADSLAQSLRVLDPSHPVFRQLPGLS